MDNMGSSSSLPENLKVVLSFLYCQFMLRASENCLVAFELTLLLLILKKHSIHLCLFSSTLNETDPQNCLA